MGNRRFLRILAVAVAALGVLIVPALADELIGRITAVNIDAKKLTVKEKDSDKDIDVTVTDETEVENAKGKTAPINLEKMKKAVEKSKKGIAVEITHEKAVASKIVYKANPKKKAEPKAEGKKDAGK